MDRNIVIVTGSRSEFGILLPVIQELEATDGVICNVIVTGSHLAYSQGMTVNEVYESNIKISAEVPMMLDGDTNMSISTSVGIGIIGIAQELEHLKPDIMLILGDRFEIFAACVAATTMQIPIAHIAGGETDHATNIDGNIRNAITKLSHLHFVSTDVYAKRILSMGEEEFRVFNVGIPSLDNIMKNLLSRKELEESLKIKFKKKIFVMTYLPVGIGEDNSLQELGELLKALDEFSDDAHVIITLANADSLGRKINEVIKAYSSNRDFVRVYQSLGRTRYLSLINISDIVIGNSSSGIIEVPIFKKPTINVGKRQSGRIKQDSVINVDGTKDSIVDGINKALYNEDFRKCIANTKNCYGDGNSSKKIARILKETDINRAFIEKKLI